MDDPCGSVWMLIHFELGERKLDFYALQNSFSCRLNPADNLLLRKSQGLVADLLLTTLLHYAGALRPPSAHRQ